VFLGLRLYPVFAASPVTLDILLWVGAATALATGLIATAEADLKRVLAWSTCSQLGEMMVALGLGGSRAATHHLAAHAAIKSTLFLAAGVVQERTGTRALDRLGGLVRTLPLAGAAFLVAALALAGV
ncbi:NADH-quinone oxidoreductase subunit L, partial [Escherichia coli]|nr:NADH-quinone oxidoreductase subunit L [Escherichia coli]